MAERTAPLAVLLGRREGRPTPRIQSLKTFDKFRQKIVE